MDIIDVNHDQRFKDALIFLDKGLETNRNPKPVGEHSIKVANRLLTYGYSKTVVTAALLHDLVEDTDVKLDDIVKKFGIKVGELVECMTYDVPSKDYQDKFNRFLESKKKVKDFGKEAVALDAADFIENSYFYHRGDSQELMKYLKKKYEFFMQMSKPFLYGEQIWDDLLFCYEEHVRQLS